MKFEDRIREMILTPRGKRRVCEEVIQAHLEQVFQLGWESGRDAGLKEAAEMARNEASLEGWGASGALRNLANMIESRVSATRKSNEDAEDG